MAEQNLPAGRSYSGLLIALYAATFIIRFSFSTMIIVFPLYLHHLDRVLYGIVWAASPAAEFITVVFIGAIIDRYGRKPILMAGLLLGTLVMLAMAVTAEPLPIAILNALHGISAGAILASSLALLADYAPANIRGREMGMFDGANMSGWGAGFLIGGLINEKLASNLNYGFILAGAVGFAACIYANISVSEPQKGAFTIKQLSGRSILKVLTRRDVLLLTMPWLMIYIMIGSALAFSSLEGSRLDIPAWQIGAALAGVCIFLLSTQRFFGHLSDKYGRTRLMQVGVSGIVGLLFCGLGIYAVGVPKIPQIMDNLYVCVPMFAVMGLFGFMAFAFAPAALASLGDVAKKKQHGVTMSVYSMVISMGMFIGVPVSGAILNAFGLPGILWFFGVLVGLMLVFVLIRSLDVGKQAAAGQKAPSEEEE